MKKTSIAIFEDNKVDGFIYEKIFSHVKDPVEFFLFNNPDKGYEMARQVQFDIAIIEIHFWGDTLSGIKIFKKLREIYSRDIITVAVTSMLQKGDFELILSTGFTMCIEKPLAFTQINSLLSKLQKV